MLRQFRGGLILFLVGMLIVTAYAFVEGVDWLGFVAGAFALILAAVAGLSFRGAKSRKGAVRRGPKTIRIRHSHLQAVSWAFQISLVAYLGLLIAQQFVDWTLNLNYLLGLVLITGVLTALFVPERKEGAVRMQWWDHALVGGLAVLGAVLVWLKTGSLEWLQWVLSILSGALIVLLGYLVFDDDKEEPLPSLALTPTLVVYVLAALFVLASALMFVMGWPAFRVVFGAVFVLFVPGFALTYSFFGAKEIDVLERIALSFALSIAVVPLVTFYLNLVGMPIRWWTVSLVIIGVTVLAVVIARKRAVIGGYFRRGWKKVAQRG